MNKTMKWGTVAMLTLAMFAATPALARDDHRGRQGHGQRDYDRHARHDRRHDNRRHHDRGRYDRADWRRSRDNRRVVHYAPPRGVYYRPAPVVRHVAPPRWARGGYVHHYQRPIYVVNDYRGYGLRHPPRGHHWVRDDYGDYLLVAIATGLIADLMLNR